MLKIRRGEESKLTSWFFEIDKPLLMLIGILIAIGAFVSLPAGAANAAKIGQPWYHFAVKAIIFYIVGIFLLFGCSMMNKKQIIRFSVAGLIVGLILLLITHVNPTPLNHSSRWAVIGGFKVMPAEILKPFFIVLTAWFLEKMHSVYGDNIFTKETLGLKKYSWWPYILLFAICVTIIFKHPDFGMSLLYVGVLCIMLFVARFPLKILIPAVVTGVIAMSVIAFKTMGHVQDRSEQMFHVARSSQVWFSLNAIRHGGLLGSGEKAFVKDRLAESVNDFVYASIVEDFGAIAGCLLIVVLFMLVNNLIKRAMSAKDEFVVYVLTGAVALFVGQVCFNLMTALHIGITKGMTLPFVSYGGWAIIILCILFGMVLGLIREDTWNR